MKVFIVVTGVILTFAYFTFFHGTKTVATTMMIDGYPFNIDGHTYVPITERETTIKSHWYSHVDRVTKERKNEYFVEVSGSTVKSMPEYKSRILLQNKPLYKNKIEFEHIYDQILSRNKISKNDVVKKVMDGDRNHIVVLTKNKIYILSDKGIVRGNLTLDHYSKNNRNILFSNKTKLILANNMELLAVKNIRDKINIYRVNLKGLDLHAELKAEESKTLETIYFKNNYFYIMKELSSNNNNIYIVNKNNELINSFEVDNLTDYYFLFNANSILFARTLSNGEYEYETKPIL